MSRVAAPFARELFGRIASPVIVEANPGFLEKVSPIVRDLNLTREVGAKLLPSLDRIRGMAGDIFEFRGMFDVMPRFNYMTAFLGRRAIEYLAQQSEVRAIYPDRLISILQEPDVVPPGARWTIRPGREKELTFTSTYWTRKLMGADAANAMGFGGEGVLVSVVDTGSASITNHPMTLRMMRRTAMPGQYQDENGHGVWCATCIGGTKMRDTYATRVTGVDVECEGMAPKCNLLGVKSLGFLVGTGSNSTIIRGLHISLEMGANIVSMSLGGSSQTSTPEEDPFHTPLQALKDAGVIVCCAAGNSGPNAGTINSPGALPNCLTVGSYSPFTGDVSDFSSRGPTNWGDTKPDCIAPGEEIDSGIGGILDLEGDRMKSIFTPISGTSMATPHSAGILAPIMQLYRKNGLTLTLDEVKRMLSSRGLAKSNDTGWGRLTWSVAKEWLGTQYG